MIYRLRYFLASLRFRLLTGHSISSLGFLPVHARNAEFRRMITNAELYRQADLRARKKLDWALINPILAPCLFGFLVILFYGATACYGLTHQLPTIVVNTKKVNDTDKKWDSITAKAKAAKKRKVKASKLICIDVADTDPSPITLPDGTTLYSIPAYRCTRYLATVPPSTKTGGH